MSFPRRLLNHGEEVVVDVRPHWVFVSMPLLSTVGIVAGTIVVVIVVPHFPSWATLGLVLLIVVCALWLAQRYVRWTTTRLVLTSQRLVIREGVFVKHSRDIPLDRVNDVTSRQTLSQRLLGSGSLLIESGGERGQQLVTAISHPEEIGRAIHHEREQAGRREANRAGPGVPQALLTLPEQLERLHELLARGVITQAEFEVTKAQLLNGGSRAQGSL